MSFRQSDSGQPQRGETVLITGGAGFIGSHVVDRLMARGCCVRVLDRLDPQVHGDRATPPDYLDPATEFIHGDVTDHDTLCRALDGVSRVIHLAAAVGVGQSMYEIEHYTRQNELATAVLLEEVSKRPDFARLVVASSMSIYGEGTYVDADGQWHESVRRDPLAVRNHEWEPVDNEGRALTPVPTDETKPADVSSVYALGKYAQERMCLIVGQAYNVPTVALRFFNVYGPRQSLSNPYTGVMAIFSSRLLNGKPPLVYEDGSQQRDFVSVHDVAEAVMLAALKPDIGLGEGEHVFNIGSGRPVTILELATRLAKLLGREDLAPTLTGRFRVGDIRHCFADIGKAKRILGYEPKVSLEDGVAELAEWLASDSAGIAAIDRAEDAGRELAERGLSV